VSWRAGGRAGALGEVANMPNQRTILTDTHVIVSGVVNVIVIVGLGLGVALVAMQDTEARQSKRPSQATTSTTTSAPRVRS
jgi:hypothetical protein